ncbi:LuxR family transcriptional regulator [Microbacterium sp. Leaf320]|uniref:LuxR family transcriptional regulator n=1 Tax=Microbacterium sp. Leaf320 TaxID=1736334 RepID=UPI0006F5206D|nr:LuxR family transcriptional regulator [Microbacterium sp. Leaf320]KQQ62659.1 hypothetical protein ASF63_18015 [Microbacterium sp. Leaf320]
MEPSNRLIGREDELARLLDLIQQRAPLVTVSGPPGVGKTSLVEAAVESLRGGGAMTLTVNVDRMGGDVSLAEAVAKAADVLVGAGDSTRLGDFLGSHDAIVILDAWVPSRVSAVELTETLLSTSQRTRVVVTSHTPVNVVGETVLVLGALSLEVRATSLSEAARVYAATANAHHRLSVTQSPNVEKVARRLGGVPYALEVVASCAGAIGLEQLEAELAVLAARNEIDGQEVALALEWVWGRLSPELKEAWSKLAFIEGDFTLQCAIAVLDEGAPPMLEALVSANLLRRIPDRGLTSFRMSQPARTFGASHLTGERELMETLVLYAARLGRAALAVSPKGPQELWTIRADAERAVLRQALTICFDEPRLQDHAIDIAFRPFRTLWWPQGHTNEVIRWARKVNPPDPDSLLFGFSLVFGHIITGAFEDAERRLAEARRISRLWDSEDLAFAADYVETTGYLVRGMFREAHVVAQAMAQTSWNRQEHHLSSLQLAMDALFGIGDLDQAAATALDLIRPLEGLGERWYRSMAMGTLALIRSRKGLHREAISMARDGLKLARTSGVTLTMSAVQTIAVVAYRAGLSRLSAYLEGGVEANASTVAFYRPMLTATGDLPEMRRGLLRELGAREYTSRRESSQFAPLWWLVTVALDDDDVHGFELPSVSTEPLTAREEEVARLIAEGATNQQIAELLIVSRRTVETHVARIFRKLGVSNRAELAGKRSRRAASG